jgi:hypothetical protein
MRRLFALIVVLTVSGVLPLMAGVSACAATPCCRAHTSSDQSITAPSCCKETSCSPAVSDVQATNQIAKILIKPSVATVSLAEVEVAGSRYVIAELLAPGSPPAQQRRLAVLSTLLI